MNRKQIYILIALAVVVLIGVAAGIIIKNRDNTPIGKETSAQNSSASAGGSAAAVKPYSAEIPKGAIETAPAQTIPLVSQPNAAPGAKFGVFRIAVGSNGYSPSSITVKQGDTVEINLETQDGKYDIFSSSAGFYTSASPGKPGKVSFQAGVSGTFLFNCRDLCPGGAIIRGSLIVLP